MLGLLALVLIGAGALQIAVSREISRRAWPSSGAPSGSTRSRHSTSPPFVIRPTTCGPFALYASASVGLVSTTFGRSFADTPAVFQQLLKHPLTEAGMRQSADAWKRVPKN